MQSKDINNTQPNNPQSPNDSRWSGAIGNVVSALVSPFPGAVANLGEKPFRKDNQNLICDAARHGKLDTVQKYVEAGTNIDAKGKFERTALGWAVDQGKDNVVRYLVEQKANLNITDVDNRTPLFIATVKQSYGIMGCLLAAGANMHIVGNLNPTCTITPYEYAAQKGDIQAVSVYIKHGLNIQSLASYMDVVNKAVQISIQ